MKSGFDWPSNFREKDLKLEMVIIYMYITPGQGQTIPGVNFFINTFIQSIEFFTANFPK